YDTLAIGQLKNGESYLATHPTYANPTARDSVRYKEYKDAQLDAKRDKAKNIEISRIYIDDGAGALQSDFMQAEMAELHKAGVRIGVISKDRLDRRYSDDFV